MHKKSLIELAKIRATVFKEFLLLTDSAVCLFRLHKNHAEQYHHYFTSEKTKVQ